MRVVIAVGVVSVSCGPGGQKRNSMKEVWGSSGYGPPPYSTGVVSAGTRELVYCGIGGVAMPLRLAAGVCLCPAGEWCKMV